MITPADLRAVACLRGCGEDSLAFVARNAADVRVAAGDWVLRDGETAHFFLILEGAVEVIRTIGGRSSKIIEFSAGDSFGEVSLLLGLPAVSNVRATTNARFARLDAMPFWHAIHAETSFARCVFENLAQRIESLREAAYKAPAAQCSIVGDSRSAACHELRDFLTRMHVPYDWEERDGEECEAAIAGGETLHSPGICELAGALGLSLVPKSGHYDVTIVGGGPAGLAAAVYGASEGLQTLLIDRYAPGGQAGMSSRIENYLGFPAGISGEDLASRAFAQARRFGADAVVVREVRAIDGDEGDRRVVLENGEVVRTRTAVIATGVTYRRLEADGCNEFLNRGVFYGSAQTEAPSVTGRDIHILGGGNSAGQAAMYFSPYAKSVRIVIRGGDLAKSMSAYLIEQIQHQQNVSVVTEHEVAGVTGRDHLERIALRSVRDGRVTWEPSGALFVFIGAVPASNWLRRFLALDERGFVLTGAAAKAAAPWGLARDPYFLETSQPGIFAAGDVRKDSIKRVAAGVGEGSSAISLIHSYMERR